MEDGQHNEAMDSDEVYKYLLTYRYRDPTMESLILPTKTPNTIPTVQCTQTS